MKRIVEIKGMLKNKKGILRKQYGVKEIGIFGSYIRGENKIDSDLDVLIEFDETARLGLLGFVHLENYLSEFLGVKVDLVMKASLKPRIGKRILEEVVYL